MPSDPPPSAPCPDPGRRFGIPAAPLCGLLGGVLVAVLVVVAGKPTPARAPEEDVPDAPLRARDPVWAEREHEVQQLVEDVRRGPVHPDETPPHPMARVPLNPHPDYAAFHIGEDHRTYDLRAWRPVRPDDGVHAAAVVMTRRLRLTKTAPADRLDVLGRTSGADLVMRCVSPRPADARLFASEYRPVVEGKGMTEHRLSVDVADVPVGADFELVTRTTFWNSLQTPEEQWFGTIGYDGSRLLSVLILFPEARPFQGGGLRNGPALGALAPYDGTQVVFKGAGGAWVYWEVPGPKTGHVYRVDWKW